MGTRTARLRPPAAALAAAAALLALTACGHENDGATARDGAAATSSAGDPTTDPAGTAPAGDHPDFAPRDYSYRLEVLCYCPQVGAVRVRVRDGAVVSARMLQDARSGRKGAEAPAYARKTINDIIALADQGDTSVEVSWPDGQDYPTSVAVDHIAEATDDEVTYTIRDVQVQ